MSINPNITVTNRLFGIPAFDFLYINDSIVLPGMTPGGVSGIYAGAQTLVRIFQAAPAAGGQSVGQNVFVGHAGNSTMTNGAGIVGLASYNTGIGYNALTALTTGGFNVACGWNALASNMEGAHNSAFGYVALNDFTGVGGPGIYNTSVGSKSLYHSINAQGNTAIGAYTMYWANGDYNTAVGYAAINMNTSGAVEPATYNAAFGALAMQDTTSASYNVALGARTLQSITTAERNVAIGFQALYTNTTGSNNTAVGNAAGLLQGAGVTGLVALGNQAGRHNTTSDRFYVNNRARASEVEDQTLSLLYGIFADLAANQHLVVNTGTLTTPGTIAGAGFLVGAVVGIDASITTASLVGKTITVTKGIITGFA